MSTSRRALVALALYALAAFAPAIAATPSSPSIAAVETAYDLLMRNFYRHVDAETLFAGAERGIERDAARRGKKPFEPDQPLPASVPALDRRIVEDAAALKAPVSDVADAAIAGMAQSVHDRWTTFLSRKDLAAFTAPLDPPSIFGIGVLLQKDPSKYVRAFFVVPNGPADRAGVASGDLITSVSGRSTTEMTQPQVSKLLRGQAGTRVEFTYVTDGGESRSAVAERGAVRLPTVVFYVIPGTKVGYVYVAAFGAPTAAEFTEALRRLQGKTNALVVDLRDDGGGYVNAAVSIASHFFDSGPVVTSIARDGTIFTQDSDDESPQVSVPAVVLVNGYTASASEIAAGALQDAGAAVLLGTRTFGKGVEQTISRLPDGSAIKITIARYVTPNNRDLNAVGLKPDVPCAENARATFGVPDSDSELRCALTYLNSIAVDQNQARP